MITVGIKLEHGNFLVRYVNQRMTILELSLKKTQMTNKPYILMCWIFWTTPYLNMFRIMLNTEFSGIFWFSWAHLTTIANILPTQGWPLPTHPFLLGSMFSWNHLDVASLSVSGMYGDFQSHRGAPIAGWYT